MQILIALIVGAVVGIVAHFTVSHRDTRGVALAPILGTFVSGAVWMALTWAGLGIDNPWIWIASVVAPLIVVYPVVLVLARSRSAHDTHQRHELRITQA